MIDCTNPTTNFSIVGNENMKHERIKAEDTPIHMILKLSERNPGAIVVCTQLLNEGDNIDPDACLGGLSMLLDMDTFGIYGSRIWMLYKNVCKENLVNTITVLRACQLGFISRLELNTTIDNYGKGINIENLYKQVKECLPKFNSELI